MNEKKFNSIEKSLEIIGAFSIEKSILSLRDIKDITGFNITTVHRIAKILEKYNYLHRIDKNSFALGNTVKYLEIIYKKNDLLSALIKKSLITLRDLTGETSSYFVKKGNYRVCLYRYPSTNQITHNITQGTKLPIDRGASGMIFKSYLSKDRTLEKIRKNGHYIAEREFNENLTAIAVPVIDKTKNLLGTMAISGLASRIDKKKQKQFLELLINESKKITSVS